MITRGGVSDSHLVALFSRYNRLQSGHVIYGGSPIFTLHGLSLLSREGIPGFVWIQCPSSWPACCRCCGCCGCFCCCDLMLNLNIFLVHIHIPHCEPMLRNHCFAERFRSQVCDVVLTSDSAYSQSVRSDFILYPQVCHVYIF